MRGQLADRGGERSVGTYCGTLGVGVCTLWQDSVQGNWAQGNALVRMQQPWWASRWTSVLLGPVCTAVETLVALGVRALCT